MNSLDDIFLTAREIANPAERAAYLAKACGDAWVHTEAGGALSDSPR